MSRFQFSAFAKPNQLAWTLVIAFASVPLLAAEPPPEEAARETGGAAKATGASAETLVRLDNGDIALGLERHSGGAIAWLSASGSTRNLVNAYDRGRLIQQSYYGQADGSLWNGQPWKWNPVQGGDWRGHPARILELRSTPTTAYVKTLPKHWASGEDVTTASMEQWIELDGPIARVRYRFVQRGGSDHPARHQELPAVFVDPALRWLVLYTGDAPWTGGPLDRSQPGWPNETRAMPEHWAAYVDDQGFGLGVYVPVADRLTCYRYGKDASAPDACSYLAPLGEFAITADFEWQYEVAISIGSVDELRERFGTLAAQQKREAPR